MSAALHRLTGYPERCIDFGNCTHAFVVTASGAVLDVHGEHTWGEFLRFLVSEGSLLPESVASGKVKYMPIPGEDSIEWRDRGYKPPTETAIRKAISVAKKHSNLLDSLSLHMMKASKAGSTMNPRL